MSELRRTPREVADALQRWLAALPADWPAADPLTRDFCRARLAGLGKPEVLAAKLAADLGERPWRPLGHVLAVISEHDHLGVVAALLAAALTGNRLTLKARHGLPVLLQLRDALGLPDDACRIADWDSGEQDDHSLLQDVDGILLAGGEALIRHYRQVAAAGVRLIEYGPQASLAWIAAWPTEPAAQAACVDALIRDTVLFAHQVCSSPQCVLLPDADAARALLAALSARLGQLPPLPDEVRLAQSLKAAELTLLARLDADIAVAFDATSGWGATLTAADPERWLPRGFRLVVGTPATLRHLFPAPQTLGVFPYADADLAAVDALHCCPLGRMHERAPTAPHDGHHELAQWVRFTSRAESG